nr:MAG TPA: hypothetical protein [Bacteriophage sp.]DAZ51547.1 MAG TPA: hypothetical protein [Caudoviricetes sp.]
MSVAHKQNNKNVCIYYSQHNDIQASSTSF